MAAPTSADLATLLGRTVTSEQGGAVISVVSAMAKSYTRGVGWTDTGPNDEIRAVILTASARLLSNPRGLLMDETKGPESVSYRSSFTGWTLAELFVLNRYRVTAL
ncbi:hypothetical protein Mycsm_04295 [Mycobacterium sp. JS623]|uniref:hypothetical protein n=1 Tax=Mycobacterium sp. JS623 TaxID=212767 RepID=UPI0002A57B12|nr:hypothetical protein [Mycobacterium sp. JS623]AGB24543.1 hypothetical protein Mycsm_04295 [Mycobacterium sp. JS623]